MGAGAFRNKIRIQLLSAQHVIIIYLNGREIECSLTNEVNFQLARAISTPMHISKPIVHFMDRSPHIHQGQQRINRFTWGSSDIRFPLARIEIIVDLFTEKKKPRISNSLPFSAFPLPIGNRQINVANASSPLRGKYLLKKLAIFLFAPTLETSFDNGNAKIAFFNLIPRSSFFYFAQQVSF